MIAFLEILTKSNNFSGDDIITQSSYLMPTIVWALEEVAFMFVLAMVLLTFPSSILAEISS